MTNVVIISALVVSFFAIIALWTRVALVQTVTVCTCDLIVERRALIKRSFLRSPTMPHLRSACLLYIFLIIV
ncbi:MAG: hypothetical protein HY707_04555 [Ignavibacteriae bacterium]|nr:hypothetical protein [Ignavibacteriota bacterium]